MSLSKVSAEEVLSSLKARWGGSYSCPACTCSMASLLDHIVFLDVYSIESGEMDQAPMLAVMCMRCNHVDLYPAKMYGVQVMLENRSEEGTEEHKENRV